MEDVSRDRGQLILITGLVIATILVATVLILNTAIYTENLGTRDTGSDASEAIEFRDTIESGSEELLANEDDETVDNALDQYFEEIEQHYLTDSTVATAQRTNSVENQSVNIEIEYRTSDLQYEDTVEVSA